MALKRDSRTDGEPRRPIRLEMRESLVDRLDRRRQSTGRTRIDTIERMLEWALDQPETAAPIERKRV